MSHDPKLDMIWQKYGQNIKALLHSKVSNPDDVDDLLQDVLLKTHQNIGTLKSQEKLKPWLLRLTYNTLIDFYRKQGLTQPINSDDLWYNNLDQPEVAYQLSQCILPFIHALPADTATLLQAIDIEGQSQKQYATTHNINYSALKSQVQRGRKQLRNLFEECCHFEQDKRGNIAEYHRKSTSCSMCGPKS